MYIFPFVSKISIGRNIKIYRQFFLLVNPIKTKLRRFTTPTEKIKKVFTKNCSTNKHKNKKIFQKTLGTKNSKRIKQKRKGKHFLLLIWVFILFPLFFTADKEWFHSSWKIYDDICISPAKFIIEPS